MKTNLCDIGVGKSSTLMTKLRKIYSIADYEKGDQLNIIQGNNKVAIIVSQKYLAKIKKMLKGEKILNIEKDLVSLSSQSSHLSYLTKIQCGHRVQCRN